MLTSIYYFLFLFLAVIIYWSLLGRTAKTAWLTVAGLGFVSYHSRPSLYYLLYISSFTYAMGYLIHKKIHAKVIHSIGVFILGMSLFATKYLPDMWASIDLALDGIGVGNLPSLSGVLIPLGMSYLVFKYISYLTDILTGVTNPGKPLNFLCYGSLFTIYLAGPIERYERINPQLERNPEIDGELVLFGFSRIVQGLAKKYLVVNWVFAEVVNKLNYTHGILSSITYVIAYAIYIYVDFSSYSDIAIGSSAFFGIRIRENFSFPYGSRNITEFWQRWHISLSEWIRDYVFFPLANLSYSRKWLLIGVPLISMGICGVWHGSGWKYLLWGLSHGVLIALYQMYGKKVAKKWFGKGITNMTISNILLMMAIFGAWYFFYPDSAMSNPDNKPTLSQIIPVLLIMAVIMVASYMHTGIIRQKFYPLMIWAQRHRIVLHTILLMFTLAFGVFNTDNTFLYADF